jgi:hypothetical protein
MEPVGAKQSTKSTAIPSLLPNMATTAVYSDQTGLSSISSSNPNHVLNPDVYTHNWATTPMVHDSRTNDSFKISNSAAQDSPVMTIDQMEPLPDNHDSLNLPKDNLYLTKDNLAVSRDSLTFDKENMVLSIDSPDSIKENPATSKESPVPFEVPQLFHWSWTDDGRLAPKSRLLLTKKNRLSDLFSSSEEEQQAGQDIVRVHATIGSYEIG